jgi:hypothetical protein
MKYLLQRHNIYRDPTVIRWEAPHPNRPYSLNNQENSNIEKLWTLNQQLDKILLVPVVAIAYVWFTTPLTFYVSSTIINS